MLKLDSTVIGPWIRLAFLSSDLQVGHSTKLAAATLCMILLSRQRKTTARKARRSVSPSSFHFPLHFQLSWVRTRIFWTKMSVIFPSKRTANTTAMTSPSTTLFCCVNPTCKIGVVRCFKAKNEKPQNKREQIIGKFFLISSSKWFYSQSLPAYFAFHFVATYHHLLYVC